MLRYIKLFILIIALSLTEYGLGQNWPTTDPANNTNPFTRDILYDAPTTVGSLDNDIFSTNPYKDKEKTNIPSSDPVVNDDPGGPGGGGGGGGNPPEDGGVPLDGGITVLLALGAGMRMRKKNRQKKNPIA